MDYFAALDLKLLRERYPVGQAFMDRYVGMSKDELFAIQNERFLELMGAGWKVPFYQRHWGAAGIEPGDIKSLEDITRLPTYSKDDLMASVEKYPPLGDFNLFDTYPEDQRPPLVFQTTSGTTGRPQPLLYGPMTREVQNLLLGRLYQMQGLTNRDVVHSVYGHGTVNGGHYIREAVSHWVGAQFLSAGTGIETRSAKQVELMRDFGVTAIVGFGDYIRKLAIVAKEAGFEPGRDIPVRMISGHLGSETAEGLGALWGGAQVFDWYGVGDTGAITGQGADRTGQHIMEDAQYVELLDVDTHEPVADGELGDLVCTCLYTTDVFPIIRFNTHDVTRVKSGDNPLNLPFRQTEGFLGRSDNMVKLRGINIYPQGIGAVLSAGFAETNGEYFCEVVTHPDRAEMTVHVEATNGSTELSSAMEDLLRSRLGVQIEVKLCAPGATAEVTQLEKRQKPIRLVKRAAEGVDA
ncbi:phenylacetate--CoA ligase family protein [Celeribacter litoreus]|uniref:phenylacetate--CoA ligase family protein n=1 Tax=Celeribacter litoreus TaxID=2876714 RepID=UPI001CCEB64C|nr:hypothetical protein [Celeribacter litoreus]MCA0042517.1 hypothetical protein [Celeribacter litoreus]